MRTESGVTRVLTLAAAVALSACLGSGGEFTSATLTSSEAGDTATGTNPLGTSPTIGAVGASGAVGTDGNGTSPGSTVTMGGNNTVTPVQAAAGGPPAAARGATVPYWEYEAEAATTTGQVLPKSITFGDIASEASGRQAVRLSNAGEFVQFKLEHPANSIVVRYAIPDAPGGGGMQATLGLYVGASRLDLNLTSRYAWTYGDADAQGSGSEQPSSTTPHHYFDEAHILFDTMPAGTVIKLQKDAKDSAAFYVIDLVDFELVAAPATQPAGSLSVTDFGAIADDGKDDSAALQAAFDAGRTQKKVVWIPKGVFNLPAYDGKGGMTFKLKTSETTIMGAGMWYSVLSGFGAMFEVDGNNNNVSNLAVFGDVTYRDDSGGWQGFNGPWGTNSNITNVWIEHVTAGMWVGKGAHQNPINAPLTDGLVVTGMRIRNLYADGINLANATSNTTVTQCSFRNTGDDSMATWSYQGDGTAPCKNNTFKFNTAQNTWRAAGMALYGGQDITFSDNVVYDTSNYPGMLISTTFSPLPLAGTMTCARNSLIRAGGMHYGQPHGALKLFTDSLPMSNINITDLTIDAATYSGIMMVGDRGLSNITLDTVAITNPGTQAVWVTSGSQGSATLKNVVVTGAQKGLQNDTSNFTITQGSGNQGL